jgi:hypothetical protein
MQAVSSEAVVVEDVATAVMSANFQDPVLRKIYDGLPALPYGVFPFVHHVTHFYSDGFVMCFQSLRTLVVNPDALNSVSYVNSSTTLPKG